MKKYVIGTVVVILIITALLFLTRNKNEEKQSNLIIVGDSRMVGLCGYQFYKETKGICIAKVGMGYNWFNTEVIDKIEKLENKKAIALNLGVNDLYNVNNYYNRYEELIKNVWSDLKIILVTVNPTKYSYDNLNDEIDRFNLKLKELTKYKNVVYCDTSSILKEQDFLTNDGLHYEKETYKVIFEKIKKCTE